MKENKKSIEFILSIVALCISFLAFIVSLWQLNIGREHNKLSVRPKLSITPQLQGPDGKNGLYLANAGLGPGTIDAFEVSTPNGNYSGFGENLWTEIFSANGLGTESYCFAKGWPDPDTTLKAGDSIALLEISNSKPEGCYMLALKIFNQKEFVLKVAYRSMYNEEFQVVRTFDLVSRELNLLDTLLKK